MNELIKLGLADPASLKLEIEQAWEARAQAQELSKPHTLTYRRREIDFFSGAMAALTAVHHHPDPALLGLLVPPIWVFNIMAGKHPRDL